MKLIADFGFLKKWEAIVGEQDPLTGYVRILLALQEDVWVRRQHVLSHTEHNALREKKQNEIEMEKMKEAVASMDAQLKKCCERKQK